MCIMRTLTHHEEGDMFVCASRGQGLYVCVCTMRKGQCVHHEDEGCMFVCAHFY